MNVDLTLDAPRLTDDHDIHETFAKLRRVNYYPGSQSSASLLTEVCVDNAYIIEFMHGALEGGLSMNSFEGSHFPWCIPLEELPVPARENVTVFSKSTSGDVHDWIATLYAWSDRFWYPYDDLRVSIALEVEYRLIFEDGSVVTQATFPNLSIYVPDATNWQVSGESVQVDPPLPRKIDYGLPFVHEPRHADLERAATIYLRRPLLERIVHPLMIGVMFCFIVMLALAESTEVFIEGAVGVLFGIFTVKQILMPAGVTSRVLLDYAVWGLFFAFAGALVPQLVCSISRIRPGYDPNDSDEPPDNETEDPGARRTRGNTTRQSAMMNYAGLFVLLVASAGCLIAWLGPRKSQSREALRSQSR